MVNIPTDITNPEDAKHWLIVNGYSIESAESIMANWSASVSPSSAPIVEEEAEEVLEDDDWEDEEESEDEE